VFIISVLIRVILPQGHGGTFYTVRVIKALRMLMLMLRWH